MIIAMTIAVFAAARRLQRAPIRSKVRTSR